MNKKKIAFVISHPIQYFSPLFKSLSKNSEVDLKVYYFSDESIRKHKDKEFGREIEWDVDLLGGYDYKFIRNISPNPTVDNVPFGLMNFGIISELKKEKFDYVIVHGWNYISHWLVFLTSIFLRIPLVVRGEMPLNQELTKSKLKIFIKKLILKPLFMNAHAFLAIGKQNRFFFKYYGVPDSKIFLAPYAIDNDFFREKYLELKDEKDKLKKDLGFSKYDRIVLFVGKLIEKKRPIDLLRAFSRLTIDKCALLFVGDGCLRKEMELYIKENNLNNVYLLGFQNQTDLPKFYTISDLFVLPSGSGETWGLVANEAMNYNLPIILSKTVGSSDDLVKSNGYVYDEGDVEELLKKMTEVMNANPQKLANMGEVSSSIIANYSYDAIIDSIVQMTKKIK